MPLYIPSFFFFISLLFSLTLFLCLTLILSHLLPLSLSLSLFRWSLFVGRFLHLRRKPGDDTYRRPNNTPGSSGSYGLKSKRANKECGRSVGRRGCEDDGTYWWTRSADNRSFVCVRSARRGGRRKDHVKSQHDRVHCYPVVTFEKRFRVKFIAYTKTVK